MSSAWAGGSTRAWRKTRARILERDKYKCQIRGPRCSIEATQVHHVLGKGVSEADEHLMASCAHCNRDIGNPNKERDPMPTPRTKW